MSTLKATNLQHPSAASPNVVMGSTGSVAVAGALTGAGMDLVASNTFTNAASASINNCFTSAYDNYRVVWSITGCSNTANIFVRLRAGGVDASGNDYLYGGWDVNIAGGTGAPATGGANHLFVIGMAVAGQERPKATMDIFNPAQTKQTVSLTSSFSFDGSSTFMRLLNSVHSLANAYDGISIIAAAGTFTGTIRVYGYRNS